MHRCKGPYSIKVGHIFVPQGHRCCIQSLLQKSNDLIQLYVGQHRSQHLQVGMYVPECRLSVSRGLNVYMYMLGSAFTSIQPHPVIDLYQGFFKCF